MSHRRPTNQSTGRFNRPIPNSNFDDDVDDPVVEATPRGPPGAGGLSVVEVDTYPSMNKEAHLTQGYDNPLLVVRRGFEVVFRVTFSQPLTEADEFQMEFLIGRSPSASKGSMITVTFRGQPSSWVGQIVEMQDNVVTVTIKTAANAIVGRYRIYVNIITPSGVFRSQKNHDTDMYLLFNPWCPDDVVFLPNESELHEYVLNDNGTIYQGSADQVQARGWMYGQFEKGILEACIYLMDAAKMPIWDRSKVLKVIRVGSRMINSNDDDGVLVGNWSDDYSMGVAPTAWTGSTTILLQYSSTGIPVCYGQCWVFAGVFNTFLRCLGIPSRVVSNFNSAHDNTGNLKTDLIFHPDGTPDRESTSDSIWNFHVWNEVWMKRTDLPDGYNGWQVVDATPQETSDGYYRCGPASVTAIKAGDVDRLFDTGFVFAEVNSDIVFQTKDKYGNVTPYKVDTTHIGKCIYTKAIGSTNRVDITHTYKHPEGSPADKQSMERAESRGIHRDHSTIPEQDVDVSIHATEVYLGGDIELDIEIQNRGDVDTVAEANLTGAIIYYTGIVYNNLNDIKFTVPIPGHNMEHVRIKVTPKDYMPILGAQLSVRFIVTLDINGQPVSAMKVVNLKTRELYMKLSGEATVDHDMYVTVSFTNMYPFTLQNVFMYMEGSGVMDMKSHFKRVIDPGMSVTWKEVFRPRLHGLRGIVAVLYCSILSMYGYVIVDVSP